MEKLVCKASRKTPLRKKKVKLVNGSVYLENIEATLYGILELNYVMGVTYDRRNRKKNTEEILS